MFRKKEKKKKTAANFYKCMVRFQMQWVRPGERGASRKHFWSWAIAGTRVGRLAANPLASQTRVDTGDTDT